jgi:hypothetical protein
MAAAAGRPRRDAQGAFEQRRADSGGRGRSAAHACWRRRHRRQMQSLGELVAYQWLALSGPHPEQQLPAILGGHLRDRWPAPIAGRCRPRASTPPPRPHVPREERIAVRQRAQPASSSPRRRWIWCLLPSSAHDRIAIARASSQPSSSNCARSPSRLPVHRRHRQPLRLDPKRAERARAAARSSSGLDRVAGGVRRRALR